MPHDIRDVTTATSLDQTATPQGSIQTAIVDDISPDGVPRVVLSGEAHPRAAATLVRYPSAAAASAALLGQQVLVVIGTAGMPVVLGPVSQSLWDRRGDETVSAAEADLSLPQGLPVQVVADRRQVHIEATDEIRLTCGKSALVMRRDGTVIVRGVKIVSRASGSNRIMGSTVGIN